MDFNELKAVVIPSGYGGTFSLETEGKLIKTALDYLEEDEVKYVYLKNLFLDDVVKELYCFTEDDIYIFTIIVDNHVKIEVIKNYVVSSISIDKQLGKKGANRLEIILGDDNKLVFNPYNESNENWNYTYSEIALEIFNYLRLRN